MRLISKRAFRQYMDFRGMTNGQLAADVQRVTGQKCSEATIALLRSDGKSGRHTAKPHIARGIEEALNAPPGSLFAASVIVASPTDNRWSA